MSVLLAIVAVALLLFAGPAPANAQTTQSNTPLPKGSPTQTVNPENDYELREFKEGATADKTCDQDVRTYAGYVWTSVAVGSPEAKKAESACVRGHVVGTGYPESCWFYDYDALRNLTTAHQNYLNARGYPYLSQRFMQYARNEYQNGEADLARAAACIAGFPGAEQKLAAGIDAVTRPKPKPLFRLPGFQPFTPFVPSPFERQVARQLMAGRPGWVTGPECPAPEGWYCNRSPGRSPEWCKLDLNGSGWYCRRAPVSTPSGSPTPGSQPPVYPGANPTLQQVANYSWYMRKDAEALLQAAGRISKAMTDAMDVTKHNDVGIGVALGGYLGAMGRLDEAMALAAKTYQKAATAVQATTGRVAALEIADEAAAEATATANQATQLSNDIQASASYGSGNPAPEPLSPEFPSPSTIPHPTGYLTDVEIIGSFPGQGNLPTCTVHACRKVANLLGGNVSKEEAFDKIRPRVVTAVQEVEKNGKLVPEVVLSPKGGLTPPKIVKGLRALGVTAEVEDGFLNLVEDVAAGKPVIAGMRTAAAEDAPLHAVVVEEIANRAGVASVRIWDPIGFEYWQPLSVWQKFFTSVFVRPI